MNAEPEIENEKANILIVDDEEIIRHLLSRQLAAFGLLCSVAEGSQEPHAILREKDDETLNNLKTALYRVKKPISGIIQLLSSVVETRDPYTAFYQTEKK